MPNATANTSTNPTTATPISLPLCRPASAIRMALDDGESEDVAFAGELAVTGKCKPEATEDCWVPACAEAECAPVAESAGDRPDSVSRFSRFKSARMSDACWYRRSLS